MNTSVGSHSLAAKYTKVPNTLDTRGNEYNLPTFIDADPTALAGKRVLMISADGPELPEIDVPMEYLKAREPTSSLPVRTGSLIEIPPGTSSLLSGWPTTSVSRRIWP